MSFGGFVRRRAFWARDSLANHGLVGRQYREVKDVLARRDMGFALEKLDALKRHAIATVPFYAGYSMQDTFPVIDKNRYRQQREDFLSDAYAGQPLHTMSTSGSTGAPLSVVQDMTKRARNIADLKVFGELALCPSHERMVMLRGMTERTRKPPRAERAQNIYRVDTMNLDRNMPAIVAEIRKRRPNTVFSYPSSVVALARYLDENHIEADFPGLKSLMSSGETTEEMGQALIAKVFGRPYFRRYSSQEMGVMGQDDGHRGVYTLNYGSYYFECLRLDSDEAAAPGEVGRIVVTDLFNYAFPMLRYDTGDIGTMVTPAAGGLPVFTDILGRGSYSIYNTKGELLSSSGICNLFWGIDGLRQYQLVQKDRALYHLKINLVGDADLSPLRRSLVSLLGDDARLDIEYVEGIPVLASQKQALVVCEWEPPKAAL